MILRGGASSYPADGGAMVADWHRYRADFGGFFGNHAGHPAASLFSLASPIDLSANETKARA